MRIENPEKCAVIIAGDLPAGLAMNAVAALTLSVGRFVDGIVGEHVKDGDGRSHTGITTVPLPVLKGDAGVMREIVLRAVELPDLLVVDFTAIAQSSRSYEEYVTRTADVPTADLPYVGVAVCGSRTAVNKLTGSLPLYH